MQYYQFHIGDYTTATVHLSPLEDLAYRRLLDFYYMKEKPIPTDIPWISRRLRLGSEDVENVLNEFFTLTDDGWENERCNADIEAFHAHIDKQRANGKKGGRPRKNPKKPTANPPQSQMEPKKSLPSTHNPVPITHVKENIYRAFAHLSMSKDEYEKLINNGFRKQDIDEVLDSIENYRKNKNYISLYKTALNWLKRRDAEAEKIARDIMGDFV